MDTTLKQRILGIIVLFALLGFCLSALLHNNKTPEKTPRTNTEQTLVNNTSSLINQSSANLTPGENITPTTTAAPNSVFNNSATTTSTTSPISNATTTAAMTTNPASTPVSVPSASSTTANAVVSTPTAANLTANANPTINQPQSLPTAAASTPVANINSSPTTNTATVATAPVTPSKIASLNSGFNADESTANNMNNTSATPAVTANTVAASPSHKATTTKHSLATAHKNPAHTKSAIANKHATADQTSKNFLVQVGSFNLAANAETLADKLHANGYSATTQKIHTAQGDMIRVVVGGKGVTHQSAASLQQSLSKKLHISGFIVPTGQVEKNNKPSQHITTTTKSTSSTSTTNSIVPDDSDLQ